MTARRLPEEIQTVLANGVPALMVTCSAEGTPNVTVISQVHYVDETHVALSFQFFNKTIKNVRENPRAWTGLMDFIGRADWTLDLEFERSEVEGPMEAMTMRASPIAGRSSR